MYVTGEVAAPEAIVAGKVDTGNRNFWPGQTFLALLTKQSRSRLLGQGVIRSLPADHLVVRQGEAGGSVWLLLDALAKVTARAENGSRALLAIRVSGDVVGEMAVVDGSVRSADVVTCGRAVVCQVKGPVFVEFLQRDTSIAFAMSQQTIQRLRWSNQRRLDFAGYDAGVCVARVLLALGSYHGKAVRDGVDVGVPLTQSELGSLVGARESTVQKALRELVARGLVRTGHRTLTITDQAGLTAYADLAPV
jgi:CRP/FNR family cyclic AMP-dependent transcriptional regulator